MPAGAGTTGLSASSRVRLHAATDRAGPTVGIAASGSSTCSSIAAATLPPGAKTGTASALRPRSSSHRDTATRRSRIRASMRCSRSGVVTDERRVGGQAAGDNRGHSLGEEKASKALPSAVAWAGSVAAGGAACQAAARRLREVGDVVIVEDPEAGLGVEDLYQVRQHERRLRAHVHDEPTGRDPPQREPDTVAAVGGAFENPPGGEVADQSVCGRQGQPGRGGDLGERVAGHRRGTSAGSA